jgi:Ni2+-binding GTPase involved in maturation of urease and hydrogenase
VRPGMEVLRVSAKTGSGFDDWLEFLTSARVSRLSLAN